MSHGRHYGWYGTTTIGARAVWPSSSPWAREILLIPVLGFFTASLLAFIALLAITNYDPLPASTLVRYGVAAVVTVGVFYLLMTEVLLVPVPKGLLF